MFAIFSKHYINYQGKNNNKLYKKKKVAKHDHITPEMLKSMGYMSMYKRSNDYTYINHIIKAAAIVIIG